MSYTDEQGWKWVERLDGSWDYGNGYVVATVKRAREWWAWWGFDPSDPDGDDIMHGREASVHVAKDSAEDWARESNVRETCARLDRDRLRDEHAALVTALAKLSDRWLCQATKETTQDHDVYSLTKHAAEVRELLPKDTRYDNG